eukprot:CAMPEP_0184403670 /NCGR_PEP_ID=MMETSP0007-20130409/85539_1 /TAXON_ID=97485 /ORGANISM="Prymnesium parvum, Strain Texoma1" /LENGTH=49 /DNA_ID= /DNA_START= /DNA_END= /DNA_ORIENTATION=
MLEVHAKSQAADRPIPRRARCDHMSLDQLGGVRSKAANWSMRLSTQVAD